MGIFHNKKNFRHFSVLSFFHSEAPQNISGFYEMVYVMGDGRVVESRPWSFGAITDMFWGFINVVVLFFRTLINPDSSSKGNNTSTDYRPSGRRPGPGSGPGSGPRIRGFRSGGAPSSPPMAMGGG